MSSPLREVSVLLFAAAPDEAGFAPDIGHKLSAGIESGLLCGQMPYAPLQRALAWNRTQREAA